MDTSETYIKMCEGAPELELPKRLLAGGRSVPWQDGDMIALNGKVFMYDDCSHSEGHIEPEVYNPNCIWLPRQDQLQEMVGDCNNPYPIIERFSEYALNTKRLDGNEWIMLSMGQLWLAFVMKEKFNKIWDGKEWQDLRSRQ